LFTHDTTFFIHTDDLFLLGILNSSCVWDYLCHTAAVLGDSQKRGRMRLKRIYITKIPIPGTLPSDRTAISALVQKCLDSKGVGCEAWEKEIDERVAALYGL
ncbi:MAG TPA: class I SAM-dependent DNA methyltransferase, partial [Acidobacteriota bacterium]|nr:class I SAM-dependent DNA methyltransferase [Acidobacteriota bacterium]